MYRIKKKDIIEKQNDPLDFTSTTTENENLVNENKSVESELNPGIAGNKKLSTLKEKLNFDQFLDQSLDSISETSYTDKDAESGNKTTGTSTNSTIGKGTKKRKRSLVGGNQAIGTDTELQNSVRQIQRDGIHTELIQNLVIQTQKDGHSVSKSNEPSVENSIFVPKIPTLPEFESNTVQDEPGVKFMMGNDPSTWPSDLPTIKNPGNTISINMKKIKTIISSVKQGKKSCKEVITQLEPQRHFEAIKLENFLYKFE